ncbi:uncharacterized protein A4U43_C08F24850 [Asparagus officinalis]|nr:uncharacterized protein A4U43_C08F24850 [Asparagus officinalis]
MGVFYAAARDPIFYSHHSNIDRLWEVWKKEGGRHQDYEDEDFREAEFLFYDEEARLVRVKVKDCLDTERLGYKYEDIDNPWLNTPPTPKTPTSTKQITEEATYPLSLDKSPASSTIKRPKISRSQEEKAKEEEVLIINGIEYNSDEYVKFDVYINAPVPSGIGPESCEFAGCFANVPHLSKSDKSMKVKTKMEFGITDLINDLGVDGDETVIVTLMLRSGDVKVEGVQIELSG